MSKALPKNVTLLNHPVVQANITRMRICQSGGQYTQHLEVVGRFLAAEATKDLSTESWRVLTRLGLQAEGHKLIGRVGLVSIARGGNGLLRLFRELLPDSSIYHVTARRDEETGKARIIDSKLPNKYDRPKDIHTMIVLDPMLATGGSAELVMQMVAELKPQKMIFVGVLAAPEGMRHLAQAFPTARIILAQVDERLNEKFYIIPGFGDGSDIENCT